LLTGVAFGSVTPRVTFDLIGLRSGLLLCGLECSSSGSSFFGLLFEEPETVFFSGPLFFEFFDTLP
jgi:hypothetical protein